MNPEQEKLLYKAMEPLGDVLTPLETLLLSEKYGLWLIPILGLSFSGAVVYEQPEYLPYFPLVLIAIAVVLFWAIRRYRRLKALYHKIEDWPYTSKEALTEAHSAITSFMPQLYGSPALYGVIMFSSMVNLFKTEAREFFRNIVALKNPLEGVPVYVAVLLILAPVLVTYAGKKSNEKFVTRNYGEPLSRLQAIIDDFDRLS